MNRRYYILDNIRAINLVSMIIYHGMWDYVYMYGNDVAWYKGMPGYVWQQSICSLFIMLSGFCWSLGKNKLKRGIIVSAAGVLISLVTNVVMPQNRIIFGVLTFLGASMLLMIPAEKLLKKINQFMGASAGIVLFILFKNVNSGMLGFEEYNIAKLPECLYADYLSTFIGFTHNGFFSTDYFSLIPWIFLFIFGYFVHKIADKYKLMDYLKGRRLPVITNIGKNSLYIYLIHQPILYLMFMLIY